MKPLRPQRPEAGTSPAVIAHNPQRAGFGRLLPVVRELHTTIEASDGALYDASIVPQTISMIPDSMPTQFRPKLVEAVAWRTEQDLIDLTNSANERSEGASKAIRVYRTLHRDMLRRDTEHRREKAKLYDENERLEVENQDLKIDNKTGLLVYKAWYQSVIEQLAVARDQRHEGRDACMMVDLDRFKKVNDLLGHAYGDIVLRKFGTVVNDVLEEFGPKHSTAELEMQASRFGGEEAIIFIPNCTSPEQLLAIAAMLKVGINSIDHQKRITELADRPVGITGLRKRQGVSIGGTLLPRAALASTASIGRMIEQADIAMYSVKKAGRNNFALYSPALADLRPKSLQAR